MLITAGATREPLDPVRFLSNRSSGKMGYALAQEAARRGANVILVSGFATATLLDSGLPPDPKAAGQKSKLPRRVDLVRVQTAKEMLAACQAHFAERTYLLPPPPSRITRRKQYSPIKSRSLSCRPFKPNRTRC